MYFRNDENPVLYVTCYMCVWLPTSRPPDLPTPDLPTSQSFRNDRATGVFPVSALVSQYNSLRTHCKRLQKKMTSTMNHRNDTPITSGNVYHDYAYVTEHALKGDGGQEDSKGSSTKDSKFPSRLHYVLGEMEKDGLQHIASWQAHGRCFIVHDQKAFAKRILPL
jgi:hypothetical protein